MESEERKEETDGERDREIDRYGVSECVCLGV